MTDQRHPSFVITVGDPAGIGPEVVCKALAELDPATRQAVIISGPQDVLKRAAALVGANLVFSQDGASGSIRVADIGLDCSGIRFGEVSPLGGEAAFRAVRGAVELIRSGAARVMVTAPINKEALNAAGHHYDGHTGMLAHLTGKRSSFMLLTSERLSTIHVSTHVSLRDAISRATTARVLETIRAGNGHMVRLGNPAPSLAVAGINPHCGEAGLFGTEDDDAIRPAVDAARSEGIDVTGPVPADTVFRQAYDGRFDLVVAQYHDQGHIPMKLVAFETTVNVTVGLPIDRASVDHGTAFDIAGKGIADHQNMMAAIAYGRRLAAAAPSSYALETP